ncbi:GRIP and coiled-coil domain-containing protein 2-like isoform X2 [Homarus americanus]|uniref:GRIP and coiled-coil domain-containing protein 2-like isoform X2 n=1 Tax=Homarus americanus TaxID=6706 RepID=UPI001C487ECE|nr:GRIP and coiled-coil domain-containing protein 2-like isoform X2 [Homarus americanus]
MESNGNISTPNGGQGEDKAPSRPTAGGGGGGLEKLTREELITKCRSLLTLAHKAKSAKDEMAAELKQVKFASRQAEVANQKLGEEADALREMVANLTEGKVALTTKIESLQRQLKVSSSEVESLQAIEQDLVMDRNHLEGENSQLAEDNMRNIKKLKEFQISAAKKSELLEHAWNTERIALEERVENLQAQVGQVDILKTKCKKLLDEKSTLEEELKRQQKLVAKGIKIQGELNTLKEEKKASEIILESTKNDKKCLEDRARSLESQVLKLKKLNEEIVISSKKDQDRIHELENNLKEHDMLIPCSEDSLKESQEKILKLEQEKQSLKDINTELKKESEAAESDVNTLREELRVEAERKKQLEQHLEELEAQKRNELANTTGELNNLKQKLLEIEKSNEQKDSELQILLQEKSYIEKSMQDEIQNFKLKEELLRQEKTQSEGKLEELHVDVENLQGKLNAMEEKLEKSNTCNREVMEKVSNLEREKNDVTEQLKNENNRLNEQLIQIDNEHSNLIKNNSRCEELTAQVDELNNEKNKLLETCEDLENKLSHIRENLDIVQKEKINLDVEFSKSVSALEKTAVEEKARADQLATDIKELKSQNTEFTSRVEQLQNEAENMKTFSDILQNTGISLTSVCREVYPMLSKNLLPADQEDLVAKLQSVQEVLITALSKKDRFKSGEDVQHLIVALEQIQDHSKNLIHSRDCTTWDLFSSSFESITKNLILFYLNSTQALDVEENSFMVEKCKKTSSAFAKLCDTLKEERFKFIQVSTTLEDLTTQKNQLENQIAEAVKEKQLSQSLEKEKLQMEENICNLEAKLFSSENRRAELESKITSGDNHKEELVNNLRQELKTVKEEREALMLKCKGSVTEKIHFNNLLKKQTEDLQNLLREKEALVSEKVVRENKIESLENTSEDVIRQHAANEKSWLDEKHDLEEKLTTLSTEKLKLKQDYASLTVSKQSVEDNLNQEKSLLEEKLNSIIKEQDSQLREAESIRCENVVLQKKTEELEVKTRELHDEVVRLQSNEKMAEQEIQGLRNEKEDLEKTLKDAENHKVQLDSNIEALTGRSEELLTELNQMNKVLRERGERISRLEVTNKEKSEELERTSSLLKELQMKMYNREAELANKQEQLQTITEKLQSYSSECAPTSPPTDTQQISKLKEEIENLEQERASLKTTIQALENEVSSSRENAGAGHDGQSEVMSTSTISRAEDTQRMKELEDTFEERYMKLKSVAIKLKKRVAELTAQLNSSEENRNKLASEKEDLKKKVDVGVKDNMKAVSKNIQVLQGEIDRLQDEVDSKTKELKDQGKQLNSAAEQLATVKSELANVQDENEILNRTVKNLEVTISSQEDAAGSLRGQITSLEKRLAAEIEKQQTLEDRRRKAEERMEEERQRAAQFVKELEEVKQDSKTRSLLDLEIRDYELTVEELNGQLGEKCSFISELQAQVEREKDRSSCLQDQLVHLTTQEATERERAEKMKEVEKQKLVIAEISSEKAKFEELARRTKLSSERQIEVLEEQLLKHKTEVQQLMAERDAVQNEFEGYKVRATSVLRQKNRPPEVNVNELQSEKDQLQADCEATQLKVQQIQSELSALQTEHNFLQSEKDRITQQAASLSEDLKKRENYHRENIASLESKMEAKIADYQMIIGNMSNQNEAMSNNFKKQLDTVRQTHSREVEQLTIKLEESEDKLWKLKNTVSTSAPVTSSSSTLQATPSTSHPLRSEGDHSVLNVNQTSANQHRRQPSHGYDEPRIDVTNMVREEGEGSEWVEPVHRSPGKPRGYSPPPLDQLINSPLPASVGLTSQDDNISIASLNTDATGKEIARLETKLSAGETRIQQLTTLLHESEAENAKLIQLSDALKEEIRRSVRNEDREKHMENMEYMKNVILKFLVLKNGEERKHLVPVLKTVLQLSPTETSQLEHLAVGEEGEGGGQAGWGSYLHLWSSR